MKNIVDTLTFIIKQRKVLRKRKRRLLSKLRKTTPKPKRKSLLGVVGNFFAFPFVTLYEFYDMLGTRPQEVSELPINSSVKKVNEAKILSDLGQMISDELDRHIESGLIKVKGAIPKDAFGTLEDYLNKTGYQKRFSSMRVHISGLSNTNSFFQNEGSKPMSESLAMELRRCDIELSFQAIKKEKTVPFANQYGTEYKFSQTTGYNVYRTVRDENSNILESFTIKVPEFSRYMFDSDIETKLAKLFEQNFEGKVKEFDFLK